MLAAASALAGCGGGGNGTASRLAPTQAALERNIDATCTAASHNGRHWSCKLEHGSGPRVSVTVNDRGAWSGSYTDSSAPSQTVTETVDGRTEVATTGDFTAARGVFGCCVPLPPD